MDIHVLDSTVTLNNRTYRCAIGENGVTREKMEGDNKTPIGCFPIREILYRADKIEKPKTTLPLFSIKENDGWCDDTEDPHYNQKITLPYHSHHERLWRDDDIYDIVFVLGYNDDPIIKNRGSAIFMHVARENYTPTEGCIALSLADCIQILEHIDINTKFCINE